MIQTKSTNKIQSINRGIIAPLNFLTMNAKDKNYIAQSLERAENSVKFYTKLNAESDTGNEYNKELNFWRGSLNALSLVQLNSRTNYKLT